METTTASRFLWHDLDSSDPFRALGFYGDVLGWSPLVFEGGPMRYWLLMQDGAPVGGVGELTDEAGPTAPGPAGTATWRAGTSMPTWRAS